MFVDMVDWSLFTCLPFVHVDIILVELTNLGVLSTGR